MAALLAASITVSGLMLTGCNKGPAGFGNNPMGKVATVDGIVITRGEYDKVFSDLAKGLHVNLETVGDPAQKQMLSDTLKQMTLQKLIMDTLVKQDAKTMGIEVTDAEVQDYKNKNIESNPAAKKELKAFLDKNLMSEKEFDETLKQSLLVEKFVDKKAGNQLTVSEAEISKFYKDHPEHFKLPEQVHAEHILVKFIEPQIMRDIKANNPKKPDAEIAQMVATEKAKAQAEADKLYKEVKTNPQKFAELAKENSDDPGSAANGGDLSYVIERNIDPSFWAALKKTQPGTIHDGVVQTQFGYHIIKVDDIKPPNNQSLVEAKPMIAQVILQEKKQKIMMEWAAKKKDAAKIVLEPEFQPKPTPAPNAAGAAAGPASTQAASKP